ncbi:FG-GAP repeat protein [Streptomyces sp. H51]|uniref:FG-GAP repeat protein n=1 Tax=Streptomyces sp. H51 TaxID=3111770 RepID=UPI003B633B87
MHDDFNGDGYPDLAIGARNRAGLPAEGGRDHGAVRLGEWAVHLPQAGAELGRPGERGLARDRVRLRAAHRRPRRGRLRRPALGRFLDPDGR